MAQAAALSHMNLEHLASSGPERLLQDVMAERAKDSLYIFIQMMWPVLEPGRKLAKGPVLEHICEHLEAVTSQSIHRLLINVPPGCMKSLTTEVFWPAWVWGVRREPLPHARFLSFAYSENLTIRDNKKMRSLIESDVYQRYWGHVFQPKKGEWGAEKLVNNKTGFKIASSIGGTGTGERGDFVIIDDPHNVKEGESEAVRRATKMWFGETLPTRVNSQEFSPMVMIMQRVHEDDVSGFAIDDDWEHLCLPMRFEPDHPYLSNTSLGFKDWRSEPGELLFPELFSERAVSKLETTFRKAGGEYAIAGQLQQRPAPREGGMFDRNDFQIVAPQDVPTSGTVIRGWDLAATKEGRAAFTVGLRMRRVETGDKVAYYIEDIARGQWTPHQVDQNILECARNDGSNTLQDFPQDPGQAGKSQVAHFSSLLEGYNFSFSLESGSKEDRAKPFSSQVGAGNVYIVRAPWTEAFLLEAETFPNGRFKDQIDAASRALMRLMRRNRRAIAASPRLIETHE